MSPTPTVPLILCQIDDYHSAAEVFASIGTDAANTHIALLGVLNANAGMAGSDSIGQAWAKPYDEAAGLALQTSDRLMTACVSTADLVTSGAHNHERTEVGADYRDVPEPPRPPARPIPCVVTQALSAAGDGLPEPFGWSIVKDAVGAAWPNGHQDKLRAAQTAWTTAATDFRVLASRVGEASALLTNQESQEIPAALATFTDRKNDLSALADICQTLGEACGEYAGHLDEAHSKILHELAEFGLETALWEAAFALLAPVTAGLSEVIGNSGLVARAAAKAQRIANIISRLAARAAKIASETVRPLVERIKPLLEKIKAWVAAARTKIATLVETPKLYPSGERLTEAEYTAKYGAPGNWRYPSELTGEYAVAGTRKVVDLPAGTRMDRYGYPGGGWLAPEGAPYAERALPPDTIPNGKPLLGYVTTGRPLPPGWRIEQSEVAPWFGEPGGGLQYRILNEHGETGSVNELIRAKYLQALP
ncbi:TNT domain-containing protein [Nocardia sp. NPDC020380]|uniref:TNT domain-containing protein n=1 Tax=Nocardia sp. NPDC020380 TaxID=3364309 RepID=UPI0037891BB9